VPIAIKKHNGMSALDKLGVPEYVIADMAKCGISCKMTANEFILHTHDETAFASVPVSLDDLMLLSAGKLPQETKNALITDVMNAIESVKMHWKSKPKTASEKKFDDVYAAVKQAFKPVLKVKNDGEFMTIPTGGGHVMVGLDLAKAESQSLAAAAKKLMEGETMPGALAKLPAQPKTVETPKPIAIKWPEFPETQKKMAPTIQLRKATMMYQPVSGTSQGSRYYVVACNNDLRIAARWSGASLSVRIEGPGLAKFLPQIGSAGFSTSSGKASKEYASVHLDVGDNAVMASKTLGAVLMGLGIAMETPLPDLAKIPKG
jgi:hypothetical protein